MREIIGDGIKENINKASKDIKKIFEMVDKASKVVNKAKENSNRIRASNEALAEGKWRDRGEKKKKKEKGDGSFELSSKIKCGDVLFYFILRNRYVLFVHTHIRYVTH